MIYHRYIHVVLFLLLGTFYSCSPKTQVTSSSKEVPQTNTQNPATSDPAKQGKVRRGFWKPDEASLQVSLQDFFSTHEAGYIFTVDSIDFPVWTAMVNLYKNRNWKGVWADERRIREVVALLRTAEYDGLLPDDYTPGAIEALLKKSRRDTSSESQLQIELLATASFMRYCRDMWSGKVAPKTVFPEWNYPSRIISQDQPMQWEHLIVSNYDTLSSYLRPQITLYEDLLAANQQLSELEKNGEKWPKLEYPGKDIKKGDTSALLPTVKRRLFTMGLLLAEGNDSVFDANFETAIKEFQQNQGLTATGTLDKKTFSRLNLTIKEIKDIIRANMERCRWLAQQEMPEEYLLINITGYQLFYIKGKKIEYSTRIVVGEEEHRTRVFHTYLHNIEFNPYWTVTRNIATKEILPLLKKDLTYLERNDMVLLKGEEEVNVYELDLSVYSVDNFPFVVKQSPGVKNALGVVKFNMPNPYSIYMHDTPSKADFDKNGRAFSHGCIRVYKPLELAEYLLKKQGFTKEQIQDLVEKKENTVIALTKKTPVFITYWTYYKDLVTNKTVFYKDIYGRDQLILKELNRKVSLKKNPVPEPRPATSSSSN